VARGEGPEFKKKKSSQKRRKKRIIDCTPVL
jgi:hypothetical protein